MLTPSPLLHRHSTILRQVDKLPTQMWDKASEGRQLSLSLSLSQPQPPPQLCGWLCPPHYVSATLLFCVSSERGRVEESERQKSGQTPSTTMQDTFPPRVCPTDLSKKWQGAERLSEPFGTQRLLPFATENLLSLVESSTLSDGHISSAQSISHLPSSSQPPVHTSVSVTVP